MLARVKTDPVARLTDFFREFPRVMVITGAGISQPSGIPTYRNSNGHWRHSEPIKYQEFISDQRKREQYWARSVQGWPLIRDAQPNVAHDSLVSLERQGFVSSIITQNVDRLHQRAGSSKVIDLHGRLDRVRCLECGDMSSRESMQRKLARRGMVYRGRDASSTRPDGDAEPSGVLVQSVSHPDCARCGGVIMPDVVFFGGSIPKERLAACEEALQAADAVLAIGSSLQVFSGYRLCRAAVRQGKPLTILNRGKTRADELALLKLDAACGDIMQSLAANLQ